MSPRLLCVGGEDHDLRIPFLLALRRRGIEVMAAGSSDPAPFAKAGIPHHLYGLKRYISPLADRTALAELQAVIAATRPDLIHSFDTKPNLLCPLAAGSGGPPVVRTINGMGWLFASEALLARAGRPIYRMLQRQASHASALTVFQNRHDQAYFEGHGLVQPSASRLVPGSGLDTEAFAQAQAAAPSISELRESLGLGNARIVMTVTRITREKGIATLLEAAALVHRQRPDVRFVLVGPHEPHGPSAISPAEIERHAPYVLHLGRRADILALLRLADLFVFPTEYREGIPRALLEAALSGLPIVATNLPGCVEVVRDGWTGLLVPPRAPIMLAGRILTLLGDPGLARALGARAAELARAQFSLGTIVGRYLQFYGEVLNPGTLPGQPLPVTRTRKLVQSGGINRT
ncbi:glycosyltransferase [Geminicoccus harenae]|uniref:glycosyltransferase n=1 Tax=Geminicoccus harenae TaxID=2498453 RepID=UPI00168A4A4A|nr:glycosyltransferase [Geminicoccus harenae]